jgi:hypothetical protein
MRLRDYWPNCNNHSQVIHKKMSILRTESGQFVDRAQVWKGEVERLILDKLSVIARTLF